MFPTKYAIPSASFTFYSLSDVWHKLSEADFWKRYFQSKLFNAHRASIRSSATQHVVKDDPIFDKYLEKDDDGMYCHQGRTQVSHLVQSWSLDVNVTKGLTYSLIWELHKRITGRLVLPVSAYY